MKSTPLITKIHCEITSSLFKAVSQDTYRIDTYRMDGTTAAAVAITLTIIGNVIATSHVIFHVSHLHQSQPWMEQALNKVYAETQVRIWSAIPVIWILSGYY